MGGSRCLSRLTDLRSRSPSGKWNSEYLDPRLTNLVQETRLPRRVSLSLPPQAADPIPADAILLNDAFEWLVEMVVSKLPIGSEDDVYEFAVQRALSNRIVLSTPDFANTAFWSDEVVANILLRVCISGGGIAAYVRDPDAGELLSTGKTGWWPTPWCEDPSPLLGACPMSAYVHPDDPESPGPPQATFKGFRRPVFFRKEEFDLWVYRLRTRYGVRPQPQPVLIHPNRVPKETANREAIELGQGKLGRPKGSGSYVEKDAPLVEEMLQLLKAREVTSVTAAAQRVRDRALGASEESKTKRLARNFIDKHGHWPPR